MNAIKQNQSAPAIGAGQPTQASQEPADTSVVVSFVKYDKPVVKGCDDKNCT